MDITDSGGPLTVEALTARRTDLLLGVMEASERADALRDEVARVERSMIATRGAIAECERMLALLPQEVTDAD